jgi:hypothetical protein
MIPAIPLKAQLAAYFFPVIFAVPIFGNYLAHDWLWSFTPSLSYIGQGNDKFPRSWESYRHTRHHHGAPNGLEHEYSKNVLRTRHKNRSWMIGNACWLGNTLSALQNF